jgi:hypothetical protein
MAKRRRWHPTPYHCTEACSETKRLIILAQLGELFYKEICSRELQRLETPSIATRSGKSHCTISTKEVANE